jgi:hypothetical protein
MTPFDSSELDHNQYQRKCKNWIDDFVDWCKPRSEAPVSFILWTGLFTLAAGVRRQVKVPKKYFGSWECSPNLYVIFVAPPGRARKSTTTDYAEDILDGVPSINKAPTIVTQASLLNRLVESSDSSVYILSREFGSFIKKSGMEMFEFLTDIFDGRKTIESSTISRGIEFAERPCVNLLAATTPRWISENMPESVIGGGFASRVIFVFEERVRRRQLYYEGLNHEWHEQKQQDLIADLKHIVQKCHGDFEIDDAAKTFMEEWYNKNAENQHENYRLHGYFERKPAHIHKIAMLLHLAYSDDLVITLPDFKKAIELLEVLEIKLPKAFQSIGKNEYAPDMDRILEYVIDNCEDGPKDDKKSWVARPVLFKEFYSNAQPNLLTELIAGLIAMGDLEATMLDQKVYYRPTKPHFDVTPEGEN